MSANLLTVHSCQVLFLQLLSLQPSQVQLIMCTCCKPLLLSAWQQPGTSEARMVASHMVLPVQAAPVIALTLAQQHQQERLSSTPQAACQGPARSPLRQPG